MPTAEEWVESKGLHKWWYKFCTHSIRRILIPYSCGKIKGPQLPANLRDSHFTHHSYSDHNNEGYIHMNGLDGGVSHYRYPCAIVAYELKFRNSIAMQIPATHTHIYKSFEHISPTTTNGEPEFWSWVDLYQRSYVLQICIFHAAFLGRRFWLQQWKIILPVVLYPPGKAYPWAISNQTEEVKLLLFTVFFNLFQQLPCCHWVVRSFEVHRESIK